MGDNDPTLDSLRLLFLTSGRNAPSSRYRVFQYLPHLRARGFPCRVANSFPEKYEYIPALGWRLSRALKRAVRRWHLWQLLWDHPDVVVLERELFDEPEIDFEEHLRKRARRLVLDVDDAIFLRHPEKFQRLTELCDGIIVGNSYLYEYCVPLHRRVTVIPTCVDLERYLPSERPRDSTTPVIGWIGSPSNLTELQLVLPALQALRKQLPFRLRIISTRHPALNELDLTDLDWELIPWREETAVESLRACDLGVMPLREDLLWNKYKCGLKLIEYMALGLPAVASPVGVNSQIVTQGVNGFLANSAAEWTSRLRELLTNVELRRNLGANARNTVAAHYSVQAWLPKLEQALRDFAS